MKRLSKFSIGDSLYGLEARLCLSDFSPIHLDPGGSLGAISVDDGSDDPDVPDPDPSDPDPPPPPPEGDPGPFPGSPPPPIFPTPPIGGPIGPG